MTLRIVLLRTEIGNPGYDAGGALRSFGRTGTGADEAKPSAGLNMTKYPLRSRDSVYPSSHKREYACSTVIVLTPSSSASSLFDGSLLLYGNTPDVMSSLICRYICR